ncbi:MAG: hypothetical protein PHC28_04855 [Flavobacterium sp.]|uniref:hypothetical protein n=1 Tax=Flavobacterium sp. TaxID=239 RepID=UPI002619A9C9|nr:hypothetical protein [Flavobacterium sp.]MDD5149795.1 hypothetical protein [Flavobacterium sp.]
MNKVQLLLHKLAEECCEVAQAASKASQFGLDGIIPGTATTNRERVNNELNDLIAIIEMLNSDCGLEYSYQSGDIALKKLKVEKYAIISEGLGFVEWSN